MAGDWIKMRVDLKDDPSVFKLAELMGVDELHVIGCLFCFWAWADKHAVDGRVDGATSRLVDRVSSTPGFSAAMEQVGWIVVDAGGVCIPNFDRHNGESAKERGLKNARQARWRAGRADVVDGAASTDASTREEKRREEIKTKTPRKRAAATQLVSLSDLMAEGVERQHAVDWLATRKVKNLPLTQTAWEDAKAEAVKAGITPAAAVAMSAAQSWAGFKESWLHPQTGRNAPQQAGDQWAGAA